MKITVLTGGVGGAKLVLGLDRCALATSITAIVNVGDDFTHMGLPVSPDLDTLLYTLAGRADPERGWGSRDESWHFMETVKTLEGPGWFALGDRDLALHVLRRDRLESGRTLSDITQEFARSWGVNVRMLPVSDEPVRTRLTTGEGDLDFQTYFVARRCEPEVRTIRFEGAAAALPAPGVIEAIADPDLGGIVIAPSNPFLSVDPILAVPGVADALRAATAPIVAVSPLVGGTAVKGPTAKIMTELGLALTPSAIAAHYGDVIDALLVDERDRGDPPALPHEFCDTLMTDDTARQRVARCALDLCRRIDRR